jgi:hypothetical protein
MLTGVREGGIEMRGRGDLDCPHPKVNSVTSPPPTPSSYILLIPLSVLLAGVSFLFFYLFTFTF